MLRTLVSVSCFVPLLASTVPAQRTLRAQDITAPVRDRGTYHVASGRWSRARPSASSGSKVLYNNSAPTPWIFAMNEEWQVVDHGRLPSPSSPASPISVPGTAMAYTIDCFRIGYCSAVSNLPGGLTIETTFYDGYEPCSDIDAPSTPAPAASFTWTGLPAGAAGSAFACWTMAFDLSNTTLEFVLAGDADGSYDADPDLDSFGWALRFPNVVGDLFTHLTGPMIAGQCPPGGAGTPTSPQQGFGTEFGGVPGATDATGLGTDDFFWFADPTGPPPTSNGFCAFFQGCGGSAANPYASYWLQLFGEEKESTLGTKYCSSLPNATGAPALLSAQGSDPHTDLVLVSGPVPNSSGQFFYGPVMLAGSPFGDGLLCVGGMTTRMLPLINAGMMMQLPNTASFTLDYAAPYAGGLVGTQHFQHWFRSGVPGAGFNTSDAVSITF